ncbi:hypothetical protein [Spirosoma rigui]|uniref:hypothetical protein n=1 Tax=Spirosoma rigui TaxID=564064 RepID=UPI0009B19E52|nr:hypothetical protein [Spirosoma rigui]
MAVDSTSIKSQIDSNLPDATDRRNKASIVRGLLKIVVDWVRDAINGNLATFNKVGTTNPAATNADDVYRTGKLVVGRNTLDGTGAALQSTSTSAGTATVSTVNGTIVNQQLLVTPSGAATKRYYKIGTLPASSGGSYARMDLHVAVGGWSAGTKSLHRLSFENRDGFSYGYTIDGPGTAGSLVIYRDTAGNHNVYLSVDNGFNMAVINVTFSVQGVLTPTLPEELAAGQPATPAGVLVLDTLNAATYPPIYSASSSRYRLYPPATLQGFTRMGGDSNAGVKITGVKSASGLTLKTSRYLELLLEDGTTVKVAEVN